MSYINDALRKVQKGEKTRYVSYDHIVSAPGKNTKPSPKWLSAIGIGIAFFFAAVMIVFLYGIEDKKVPSIQPVRQKISVPPEAITVANETMPNKKVEFQPKVKTAKVRTAKDVAETKALYTQALQMQREGKLEEAKKLYRKVIKIDQYNVQAFNNLGVIYMGEKNYNRAVMRFNNALDIKHDYVDAHYNLACLYVKKNDVTQSLFYLKNAIEFNPEVRAWAKNDGDLKALANLPEFKKLTEKQLN